MVQFTAKWWHFVILRCKTVLKCEKISWEVLYFKHLKNERLSCKTLDFARVHGNWTWVDIQNMDHCVWQNENLFATVHLVRNIYKLPSCLIETNLQSYFYKNITHIKLYITCVMFVLLICCHKCLLSRKMLDFHSCLQSFGGHCMINVTENHVCNLFA